mmetsp:Transcript_118031/g.376334  ORF Transcript_118031/g.376334 Transcript_118031/m.376334 type:complete len:231 (-) Transcript_118031:950-1642(-)
MPSARDSAKRRPSAWARQQRPASWPYSRARPSASSTTAFWTRRCAPESRTAWRSSCLRASACSASPSATSSAWSRTSPSPVAPPRMRTSRWTASRCVGSLRWRTRPRRACWMPWRRLPWPAPGPSWSRATTPRLRRPSRSASASSQRPPTTTTWSARPATSASSRASSWSSTCRRSTTSPLNRWTRTRRPRSPCSGAAASSTPVSSRASRRCTSVPSSGPTSRSVGTSLP